MKILILSAFKHTEIGGGEKYIRKVIDIGNQMGFEFEEIYLQKTSKNQPETVRKSTLISSYFSNFSKSNLFFKVVDYKIKMIKLHKFLSLHKFDLIIVNTATLSLGKKYLNNCIFIQHEDNQLYEKFSKHFYYRFFNICTIALRAKNVVCYTNSSVIKFKNIDGGMERKYFLANLFIENLKGSVTKPERLVYLGRICKGKGVDRIIEIAKLLNEPIHLYGDGPYKIGNAKNIIHHGRVAEEDLSTVFQTAKLNILLSKSEGLGFSIIEGFSYGVPCLLIDSSTNSEYLVNNGKNGILCAKGDSNETIAQKINNLDSSLFLSQQIKTFCKENFIVEKFVANWKLIFEYFQH